LSQRFNASRDTNNLGVDFYKISSQPPREALDPGVTWSSFTFNDEDYQYQRESTQVRSGGGLSVNFGLWRASSGASYSKDTGFVRSSNTTINISFEARRIVVDNYWLNPLVFQTRSWGWAPNTVGAGLGYICDGNPATNHGICGGVMPLLPVGVLLAKNIKISGNFSEQERNWMHEQISAGASFGFGPFSIGGHYSKRTEKDYIHGQVTGTGVESPQMQILGWFCKPLGKTPDPDLGMTWPHDPDVPDRSHLYRRSLKERISWKHEFARLTTAYGNLLEGDREGLARPERVLQRQ
jgi:hypothetical protein